MTASRWDSDNPDCPFHAVVDPELYQGTMEVGAYLEFMNSEGVTRVKVRSIETDPDTGLIGIMFEL